MGLRDRLRVESSELRISGVEKATAGPTTRMIAWVRTFFGAGTPPPLLLTEGSIPDRSCGPDRLCSSEPAGFNVLCYMFSAQLLFRPQLVPHREHPLSIMKIPFSASARTSQRTLWTYRNHDNRMTMAARLVSISIDYYRSTSIIMD